MHTSKLLVLLVVIATATAAQSCSNPLGIEDGRIKDDQFSASSEIKWHYASLARLNRFISEKDTRTWCANETEDNPWIQVYRGVATVRLNGTHHITAIAIQGRNHSKYTGWYVTKFNVGYKQGNSYRIIQKDFEGPKSKNEISKVSVDIMTDVVRIFLKRGNHHPVTGLVCLRMELYGCSSAKRDFCKERKNKCKHDCINEKDGSNCTCRAGYRLNKNDGYSCDDINECLEGHSCDKNTTTCTNVDGNYYCSCKSGLSKDKWDDKSCYDNNECAGIAGRQRCPQLCINVFRSYKCGCYAGYRLNKNNITCDDINECAEGRDLCDRNTTTCVNKAGGYKCKCNNGLQHKDQHKKLCIDIDECSQQYRGGCDHTCHNTFGSYYCSCNNGTYLDTDNKFCKDIDECKDKSTNNCQQVCKNMYGKYECGCHSGYSLNKDQKTCSDVDECVYKPCSDHCANTNGSFICSCNKGFQLYTDQRTCMDIDECAHDQDNCDSATSTCRNIPGSFLCVCKQGFKKNSFGVCEAKSCRPLQPIPNGYIEPSDCTKKDAKVFRDVCVFKCRPGYQLNKKSINITSCNEDGNWAYNGAGLQPLCEPIRCPKIQVSANLEVIPQECVNQGGQYNKECHVYCPSGYKMEGNVKTIKCQANGQYDGTFDHTRCVKEKPLICPNDVELVLPLGARDTILPAEKLSVKIDVNKVISDPRGVLTGQHRFESRMQPYQITLRKRNSADSCVFHIRVLDKEAPKVTKCPPSNIYISLNNPTDTVTWTEPQFQDNVGIVKTFSNIPNGVTRPEQIYFVYYAVRDQAGNEATCRFFVHVKARYCKKENIPGGADANIFWLGASGNSLSAFVSCIPPKILSANITGASIFKCQNGKWDNDYVPDCVDATPKTTTKCPDGHFTVMMPFSNAAQCAKCPKGTLWVSGTCVPCIPGFYQDETGSTSCKQCPNGTTSVVSGGKVASVCKAQCPPGSYSMTGLYGSSGCVRCPKGSYQDLRGQRSCKVCPDGGDSYEGSKKEDDCQLPARVSRIFPEGGSISAKVGDTVTVDCYGTGSPRPFMSIVRSNTTVPDSFRGSSNIQPLTTGNKHISALRMTITSVTKYDTTIYKCVADNKRGDLGATDEREIALEVV